MILPTENAASPKSARSRNSDFSVSHGTSSKWDFGWARGGGGAAVRHPKFRTRSSYTSWLICGKYLDGTLCSQSVLTCWRLDTLSGFVYKRALFLISSVLHKRALILTGLFSVQDHVPSRRRRSLFYKSPLFNGAISRTKRRGHTPWCST